MLSFIRSAVAWLLLAGILIPIVAWLILLRMFVRDAGSRSARSRRAAAAAAALYGRVSPLYRFTLRGVERLPRSGPYVLVANHESGLDNVCLMMLRTPARFLAAGWLFRAPVIGWLMRACGHIPVRRGDRESGRRALAAAQAALAEGSPVVVFPEGAYSKERMQEFRLGAFVAAKRAGAPIVPVRLTNTGAAWRPGTLVVRGRHEIDVSVLPVLSAEDVRAVEPSVLADRVRQQLAAARSAEA